MMKKEEFLSLLNNKKAVRNTAEISALKQMIEAYPYMQNAWALYLKGIDIDKDEALNLPLKRQQFEQTTEHYFLITSIPLRRLKLK